MSPERITAELNESHPVTDEQIEFFRENRFIKIKSLLSGEVIDHFNQVITKRVDELNDQELALNERDTYGKAFLQLMNLWTVDPAIKQLVMSRKLGEVAARLMGTNGSRLYHDQALFKEGGGGITPWHADQFYWPLESDKTITAWIPLQKTDLSMGPLEFSSGSHAILEGRELAISDDSERIMERRLKIGDFPHVVEPFDIGEVSFHSGWLFHRAGENRTEETRKVMTIIYMDSEMRLKEPQNDNQIADWETWCPGAKIGEIIDTKLNPVIY